VEKPFDSGDQLYLSKKKVSWEILIFSIYADETLVEEYNKSVE
jgi:hypothetical protein